MHKEDYTHTTPALFKFVFEHNGNMVSLFDFAKNLTIQALVEFNNGVRLPISYPFQYSHFFHNKKILEQSEERLSEHPRKLAEYIETTMERFFDSALMEGERTEEMIKVIFPAKAQEKFYEMMHYKNMCDEFLPTDALYIYFQKKNIFQAFAPLISALRYEDGKKMEKAQKISDLSLEIIEEVGEENFSHEKEKEKIYCMCKGYDDEIRGWLY